MSVKPVPGPDPSMSGGPLDPSMSGGPLDQEVLGQAPALPDDPPDLPQMVAELKRRLERIESGLRELKVALSHLS